MYYSIYPIHEGDFTVSFRSAVPDLKFENIPSFIFLLIGEDGETILVDTGFPPQHVRGVDSSFHKEANQDIVTLLHTYGLNPEAVRLVIQTHMHWDHTANMSCFPNARFYIQAEEFRALFLLNPNEETYYSPSDWLPLLDRIQLLEGSTEIRPGLRTILTGGHTPGHQVIEVMTRSGPIILGGDAPFNYDNLWKMVPQHFWDAYKEGPGRQFYWSPQVLPEVKEWLISSQHFERPSISTVKLRDLKKSGQQIILSHDPRLLKLVRIPE